jgi:hypothetical protein
MQFNAETAARLALLSQSSTGPISVDANDLRLLLEANAGLEHQGHLLAQALGKCIVQAGIVAPDTPMTGPQLIHHSRDLRVHIAQMEQGQNGYNALITYILENQCESPFEFLRCWNDADFDSLRNEWPDAPEEIYFGADAQHPKHIGYESQI